MKRILVLALLLGRQALASPEQLVVTTTSYEITGGLSVISTVPPYAADNDLYTIHSDAVLRSEQGFAFALNRLHSDNVLTLDAADDYSVVTQFSTGALSNPQDLLLTGTNRAYVTRYEKSQLWIVNPFSGVKLGEISLAAYADADGIPEMAQMARVGDRIFVTLQRLDRGNGLAPTGSSALLVLDADTDTPLDVDPLTVAVDPLPLLLQNPEWRLRYSPAIARLVCISPGRYLVADGGIEIVDPFALRSERIALSESTLGGDVLDALIVTPTLGWVLHSDASFHTKLRRFDPSDGSIEPPILSTNGFYLSDLELSDDGRLYVGDRSPAAPGVRVFDAYSGAPLAGPIAVGRPPFDLELVRSEPVAAPAELQAHITVSPQPSSGPTTIRLRSASQPNERLRIFDVRGRLVHSGAWTKFGTDDWVLNWDGRDLAGQTVANGTYFARQGELGARIVLWR